MFQTDSAECIDISETKSAGVLAKWLAAADMTNDDFPLDHDRAAHLLAEGGHYDVDADELKRLGNLGQAPDVAWYDARDVLAVVACLEGRRQWRATPSQHDMKKTQSRLALEHLQQLGDEGLDVLREQTRQLDLRFALLLLTEANTREFREKLLGIIEALLLLEGIKL